MKGTQRKYFQMLSEIVLVLEILLLFLISCQFKPKPSIKAQFSGCRHSLLGAEVPLWCAQIYIPVCKAPSDALPQSPELPWPCSSSLYKNMTRRGKGWVSSAGMLLPALRKVFQHSRGTITCLFCNQSSQHFVDKIFFFFFRLNCIHWPV